MSFTPGIPATGQSLGSSRDEVRNNLASLRTTISNAVQPNHIDVNNSGAGKHIFVQMPVQTPSAANLPGVNEGGFITQTVNAMSELIYARDNIATRIQMTSGTANQGASILFGQSFIPGAFQIKWGLETVSSGNSIVYAAGGRGLTNFPNSTIGVVITPTGTDSTQQCTYVLVNNQQFTVYPSKSNLQIFWVAIGY